MYNVKFNCFGYRLVHIFEAGTDGSDDGAGHCTPVNTLDNHSSSVTAMTFTSDGKRLLTCGGDKTMVFNAVDGTGFN
jgi:WD40 repeat protein